MTDNQRLAAAPAAANARCLPRWALMFSTALASAFGGTAQAQNVPQLSNVESGSGLSSATVRYSDVTAPNMALPPATATLATVEIANPTGVATASVINWSTFKVADDGITRSILAFQSSVPTTAPMAVLNRVTNGTSTIDGLISASPNFQIWIVNGNGITFSPTGSYNGGGLVLSTAAITSQSFVDGFNNGVAGGNYALTFATDKSISLQAGTGTINVPVGFAAAGQNIAIDKTVTSASGTIGIVLARDVTLNFSPNSPLGITIKAGTTGIVDVPAGTSRGNLTAQDIKIVGAQAGNAITQLLQINDGQLVATRANGRVVIATRSDSSSAITIYDAAHGTGVADGIGIAAAVTIAAQVTAPVTPPMQPGPDIRLIARGDLTSAGMISSAGNIYAEGSSLTAVTGSLSSGRDMTLLAANNLNARVASVGGNLAVNGGIVTLALNSAVLKDASVRSTVGGITIGGLAQLSAVLNLVVSAATTLDATGGTRASLIGDSVTVRSGGTARLANITSAQAIDVESTGGDLDISGSVSNTPSTRLIAAGALNIVAPTLSASRLGGTTIDVATTGDLRVIGAANSRFDTNLISSGPGNVSVDGTVTSTQGRVRLVASAGDVSSNGASAGTALILDGNALTLNGVQRAGTGGAGSVLATARAGAIGGTGALAAATDIIVTGSATGSIALASATTGTGDVIISGPAGTGVNEVSVSGALSAAGSVRVTGARISAGSVRAATGEALLITRSGPIAVTGNSFGATGVTLEATGGTLATGSASSNGNIRLTSTGTVQTSDTTAGGNLTIVGNGIALGGLHYAGGTLAVESTSTIGALGGISADFSGAGLVSIRAAGNAVFRSANARTGDLSVTTTAGGSVADTGLTRTNLSANTGAVTLSSGGSALLGTVRAGTSLALLVGSGNLNVGSASGGTTALAQAPGLITINGDFTADSNATILAGQTAQTGLIQSNTGAVQVLAGNSAVVGNVLALAGPVTIRSTDGSVTTGSVRSGGPVSLEQNGSGAATIGGVLATGPVAIAAQGNVALGNTTVNGASLTVTTPGSISGAPALTTTGATSDISVTAGTAATATLGAVSAGRDVTLNGGNITATSAFATAGTLRATASGGLLSIDDAGAAQFASLSKTGATQELRLGRLLAGAGASITSGANARVGSATTTAGDMIVNATGSVTGLAGATANVPDPSFGRATFVTNGATGATLVTAGPIAQLNTVQGRAGVRVNAGQADVTTLSAAGGAGLVAASTGNSILGSASTGTTLDVTALTGIATLNGGSSGGAMTITGRGVRLNNPIFAGTTLSATATATDVVATGNLTSVGNMQLTGATDIRVAGANATAGALTLNATTGAALATGTLAAATGLTVNAATLVSVGTATTRSGPATIIGGSVSANLVEAENGAARVSSVGTANVATIRGSTSALVEATAANANATVGRIESSGGDTTVRALGGTATSAGSSAQANMLIAGRDVILTGSHGATTGTLTVGATMGDVYGNAAFIAGGNIDVSAASSVSMTTARTTGPSSTIRIAGLAGGVTATDLVREGALAGPITVSGTSVSLTSANANTGQLSVSATNGNAVVSGEARGGAGVLIQSDNRDATAGTIVSNLGTATVRALAGTAKIGGGTAQSIDVRGSNVSITGVTNATSPTGTFSVAAVNGSVDALAALTGAGNVDVLGTTGVKLSSATSTGGMLSVISGGQLEAAALTSGASMTITKIGTTGEISIGALTSGTAVSGSGATINSDTNIRIGSATTGSTAPGNFGGPLVLNARNGAISGLDTGGGIFGRADLTVRGPLPSGDLLINDGASPVSATSRVLLGNVASAREIRIRAGSIDALSLSGALAVDARANDGTLQVSGLVSSQGPVSLSGAGGVILGGGVSSGGLGAGTLAITSSNGNITSTGVTGLSSTGAITLMATTGTITANTTQAATDTSMMAQNIALSGTQTATNGTFNANASAGTLTAIDLVRSSGTLTLAGSSGVILTGGATSGNALSVSSSGGNIQSSGATGLTANGGALTLMANAGTIATNTTLASLNTMMAARGITLTGAQTAGGTLMATATAGPLTSTGLLTSGGATNVVASGPVTLTSGATSGGTMSVSSTGSTVTATGPLSAGGALTVVGATGVSLTNASGTATTLTATTGNVAVNNATATAGTLAVNARNGAITGQAGGRGNLTATGTTSDVLVNDGAPAPAMTSSTLLGTVMAGRDVRVTAGTIDSLSTTATTGVIALSTPGALTLGATSAAGDLTLKAASISGGALASTNGALDVTAATGDATLASASSRTGTTVAATLGNVTVTGAATSTAGPVTLTATGGTVTSGGTNAGTSVAINGKAITLSGTQTAAAGTFVAGATAGDLSATGPITASGNVTLTTTGNATLAAVTSTAGTIAVSSTAIALGGDLRASTITLTNTGTGTTAKSSIGGTSSTGYALTDAEVNRLKGANVNIDAGTNAVDLSTLTLGSDVGTTNLRFLTTGAMTLSGRIAESAAVATRTVQFGGTLTPPNTPVADSGLATSLFATATATATADGNGAAILLPSATVDLRAQRVIFGQSAFIAATRAATVDTIATQFVSNAQSSLYVAGVQAGDTTYANGALLLSANKLQVRYRDFGLFQNTGPLGISAGVALGAGNSDTTRNTSTLALELFSSGDATGRNAFAFFGTINGFQSRPAAILPAAVIQYATDGTTGRIVRITQTNSRLNGCIIGSPDAGCLITISPAPAVKLFDERQAAVFGTTDDANVPFDPLVGSNNEALMGDIGSGKAEPEECTPDETGACPSEGKPR